MLAEANATLWPSLITISALILYFILTLNVGRARFKYKVSPPQMTGNPDFERVVRVHQNTLEQLILFLPSLWIFSQFISPIWAAGIGAVWIIGRILFAWGYYQAAEKRAAGFGISTLATLTLLGGSLIGIIMSLLKVSQS
ncbi:MAPEG family protein [Tychonema sp. LEGE 07199]|uniref:MAPEG family protein n=1 Tax=unclassified Tychonema TaxID=2642144 RepID=UPI001882BFF4|nr:MULTISPECIES: MAPEG family protein [unclassified Tychonema]MBE9119947.1 MAPEG family protein [Tychonema sp. LEGE 07199]MBE9134673.1 MAPEG family protein [Tychonema sp. LEGE 07196]